MKIENLAIENFKNIPSQEFNLEKVNILVGDNGKGKSSVLNALRYVLTGKLPSDPIRHRQDHLAVAGKLENGAVVKRECYPDATWRIDGETVQEKQFTAAVKKYRALYESKNAIPEICSHTNRYFLKQDIGTVWNFLETGKTTGAKIAGLKELEVKMFDGTVFYILKSSPSKVYVDGKSSTAKAVASYLGGFMDRDVKALDVTTSSDIMSALGTDDFSRYLMEILPLTVDFNKLSELAQLTENEVRVLQPLLPPSPEPISVSDIGGVYKILYETRTQINREADEYKKRSVFEGEIPSVRMEDARKSFAEINQRIGAAAELEKTWKNYRKQVADRNKMIDTYREWLTEYNNMGHIPAVDPKTMDALENGEKKIRELIDFDTRNILTIQQANAPLLKMLKDLDSTVCPLCDKLVCSTDKTDCRKDLQDAVSANEAMARQTQERIAQSRKTLEELLKKKEEERQHVLVWQKKVYLYNTLQKYKTTIPKEPVQPEPMADVQPLREEALAIQKQMERAALYGESLKSKKKYEQLALQAQLYNGLVRKAEPKKGLFTTTILGYVLQPFHEHCNAFLQAVAPGKEIVFQVMESGMKVLCKTKDGAAIPMESLSEGERTLFVFTLMDMVSSISGAKILVFDNLEALDAQHLEALLRMLLSDEIQERYDQVLLSVVGHHSIKDALHKYEGSLNIIHM